MRYGWTSSRELGPPYAITSTPTGAATLRRDFVDEVDHLAHGVHRRVRQETVPDVEDVARAATGALHHIARRSFHGLTRPEQRHRIEVALHRATRKPRPALVERHAPVQPDHVPAHVGHVFEQRG